MSKTKSTLAQRRNQIVKMVSEVVVGVILAIFAGYLTDIFISMFLPTYKSYEYFIVDSVHAVIILIVGLLVVGSFLKYLREVLIKTNRGLYGIFLIVRIVFYVVILALVMSTFHVSVTGILAGSAIGGIILGLAVQTVASNVLSSIFATSSNTIKYGEVISVNSWVWSVGTTGKIVDVKTLFSRMLTKDNNFIYLPNSELLGNSVITEYRDNRGSYTYPLNITAQADVPADKILQEVKNNNDFSDIKFFLSSKNGLSNTFEALITFNEVTELNEKMARANMAIDSAYWNIKSKFNVMGPDSMSEGSENVYPLSVTLNSDVSSEKLIEEASKQLQDAEIILLAKGATTNTFLARIRLSGRAMEKGINDANLVFEDVYSKLKDEKQDKNDDKK
jgi:small-conductance mechanosensitive channel